VAARYAQAGLTRYGKALFGIHGFDPLWDAWRVSAGAALSPLERRGDSGRLQYPRAGRRLRWLSVQGAFLRPLRSGGQQPDQDRGLDPGFEQEFNRLLACADELLLDEIAGGMQHLGRGGLASREDSAADDLTVGSAPALRGRR
jgi:hypothetical protein